MKNLFKTGLLVLCSATVAIADHTQLVVTVPEVKLSPECQMIERTEAATVAVCPKGQVPANTQASVSVEQVEQQNRKIHNKKQKQRAESQKKEKREKKTMKNKHAKKEKSAAKKQPKKQKNSNITEEQQFELEGFGDEDSSMW